jgi:hypothetical protein
MSFVKMQAGSRKNMDRMAEVVPEANSRNLQQFLTHLCLLKESIIKIFIRRYSAQILSNYWLGFFPVVM